VTNPVINFSADGILALLRSQGLRITRSRRGIITALFKATRPCSLTEIQAQTLVEGGVLPDYATVFRMMILLENLKLVHKVNLRRPCSYYELTNPSKHQDHLVCTQCGKETQVPFQPRGDKPVYCSDCFAERRQSTGYSSGGGYGRDRY